MSSTAALDAGADTSSALTLPVDADEGFPQSFLFALGSDTYRAELYVNVAEAMLPRWPANPHTLIDVVGDQPEIPAKGLLVAAVIRQGDGGDVPLLRRRLLPGVVHTLGDLRLFVVELRIALGNLNAAGSFGSVVTVKVGPRVKVAPR